MIRTIPIPLLLGLLPTSLWAQAQAPEVVVDQGLCPFECCQYGAWTSIRNVAAYRSPASRRPAFAIPKGTALTAVTGYVRSVGTPFVVHRARPPYRPGDRLIVYAYLGEGAFSIWHDGERYAEDLGFSPYGGTGGTRCTDAKHCWGTLTGELRSDWWVQVRLASGKTAWVRGSEGFEGQDACQ